jgi:hypothetical protein
MSSDIERDPGAATTVRREVCDKCGTRTDLEGSTHGFERWSCPGCQQVVGIDRDPRSAAASRSPAASPGTTPRSRSTAEAVRARRVAG